MATLAELQEALKNADAAGDTAAAGKLADALYGIQNAPTTDPQPMGYVKVGGPDDPSAALRANMQTPPVATQNTGESQATSTRDQYNALPTYQKPLVAMDDIVRKLTDGLTFGYGDKAAAKLDELTGNGKYDDNLKAQREATQAASDRSGSAGQAAELGGAIGGTMIPAARGWSAVNAIPKGANLLARLGVGAGAGAIEGGAYGALGAAGHDTDVGDGALTGAAAGGLFGGLGEGLSSTVNGIRRWASGTNRTPTVDALRATKNAAYDDVRDRGAMFDAPAAQDLYSGVHDAVIGANPHSGARPATAPKSLDFVNRTGEAVFPPQPRSMGPSSPQPISLYDIDQLRQRASGDLIRGADPTEREYGGRAVDAIDNFVINNANPLNVRTRQGTPEEAAQALLGARDASATYRKTQEVSGLMEKARRNEDGSKAGGDGSQLRTGFRQLLNSDKRAMGYSPEELAAMERVNTGTRTGNISRGVSKIAGSFPGRIAAGGIAGLGSMALGLGGYGLAATPVAGTILSQIVKGASDRVAKASSQKAAEDVLHLVATGRAFERGNTRGLSNDAQGILSRGLLSNATNEQRQKEKRRKP